MHTTADDTVVTAHCCDGKQCSGRYNMHCSCCPTAPNENAVWAEAAAHDVLLKHAGWQDSTDLELDKQRA